MHFVEHLTDQDKAADTITFLVSPFLVSLLGWWHKRSNGTLFFRPLKYTRLFWAFIGISRGKSFSSWNIRRLIFRGLLKSSRLVFFAKNHGEQCDQCGTTNDDWRWLFVNQCNGINTQWLVFFNLTSYRMTIIIRMNNTNKKISKAKKKYLCFP